jgi:hypothetical protein
MVDDREILTEKFLETNHNPSILRTIGNLEMVMDENDAELDKIVATEENLNKSPMRSKEPQDPGNKKKNGQGSEPVSSKGGCGCIIS